MQRKKLFIVTIVTIGILLLVYFAYISILRATIFDKAQVSNRSAVGEITDDEEYRVYSALLESLQSGTPTELILIEDKTDMELSGYDMVHPWELIVSDPLWDDFSIKNQSRWDIGNRIMLTKPYYLFPSDQMFQINSEMNAARINNSPFYTFSRVGFDTSKSTALIHVSVQMPGHSLPFVFGFGQYYLLKKTNGRWVIDSKQDIFIT